MDKSSSSSTWVVRQRGSKNPRLNWLGVGGREMGKQEWGAQLRLTEVFVSSDNRLIWASVKTAFFQAVYKLKLGPLMDKMERKVNFRSASHVKPSLTLILARDIWRFLQHRQKKPPDLMHETAIRFRDTYDKYWWAEQVSFSAPYLQQWQLLVLLTSLILYRLHHWHA